MKKFHSAGFLIIVLAILFVAASSVTGFTRQFGDYTTVYIKNLDHLSFGKDIGGGVTLTLAPADGAEYEASNLDTVHTIIKNRVSAFGAGSEALFDAAKSRIFVRFPLTAAMDEQMADTVAARIASKGVFSMREGSEYSGEVILTGDDILSLTPGTTEEGHNYISMNISEAAQEQYSNTAISLMLIESQVSYWLDDQLIIPPVSADTLTFDGKLLITSAELSVEEAVSVANTINSGQLPVDMQTLSYKYTPAKLDISSKPAAKVMPVIAVATVVVAVLLAVVYRVPGIVGAVALCGQVTLLVATATGYFGNVKATTLTVPGVVAAVFAVATCMVFSITIADAIKREAQQGKTAEGSINAGFKKALSSIIDVKIVVVIAVAAVGALLFNTPSEALAKLLNPIYYGVGPAMADSIHSFCLMLLIGLVYALCMAVVLGRVMLGSLSKMDAFRAPRLYGGK